MRSFGLEVGDGVLTSITVLHYLGTRDVGVEVYDTVSPYATVICDVERPTADSITLGFASAPTNNQYRVVVMA